MVTFLFSVHTITEAKEYAWLDRAEPGLEPGRWIFQPCHLTWRAWCSAATADFTDYATVCGFILFRFFSLYFDVVVSVIVWTHVKSYHNSYHETQSTRGRLINTSAVITPRDRGGLHWYAMIDIYKILRRRIDTARDNQFCKCRIAEYNHLTISIVGEHLYCGQSQRSFWPPLPMRVNSRRIQSRGERVRPPRTIQYLKLCCRAEKTIFKKRFYLFLVF